MITQAITQEITTSPMLRTILTVLVVGAGWGGWKGLQALGRELRPVWDAIWFASFQRNAVQIENHLRTEIFPEDIAMRTETRELLERTAQLASRTAEIVQRVVENTDLYQREQRQSNATLLAEIKKEIDPVAQSVNELNGEMQYIRGQVDLLTGARGGVTIPSGAHTPGGVR